MGYQDQNWVPRCPIARVPEVNFEVKNSLCNLFVFGISEVFLFYKIYQINRRKVQGMCTNRQEGSYSDSEMWNAAPLYWTSFQKEGFEPSRKKINLEKNKKILHDMRIRKLFCNAFYVSVHHISQCIKLDNDDSIINWKHQKMVSFNVNTSLRV